MIKKLTQADIAKKAGVSRATVSYVLSDRMDGSIPIAKDTRERILKIAQELGYQTNALARDLRLGLSRTIGLLIPDLVNPFVIDVLRGVEREAIAHDYYVTVTSTDLDHERERRCIASLFQQRLDGLILMPTFVDLLETEVKALSQQSSPAVFIGEFDNADWVINDLRGGAIAIMDHLIALGHRRIGFINGVGRRTWHDARPDVYREKMSALGSYDERLVCHCGNLIEDGYQAAATFLALPDPPTAILSINDLLAIGALHAIQERGLRVPDDISVAGFDDIEMARHLYPPLTTVQGGGQRMGERAAQLLFARISDRDHAPMQETVAVELVIRQSTARAQRGA